MDEPIKHDAKRRKSDRERQILMWNVKKEAELLDAENGLVAA